MRFMMLMIPGVYQGAKGKKVMSDFPPEVQKAAQSPSVKAQVEKQKR